MGRTLAAFRRNWCIWVILFFSGGIKALVNSLEQPFARSLVSCDVPLEPGVYTGSRWCGDRLQVIQKGLELSTLGQTQENASMLLMLPFVVMSTGIWGPKIVILVGLLGVVGSIVLFMIACDSLFWARVLFAMGQFLQGFFPIEYITSIIFLIMSIQPGADQEANMQLMTYLAFLAGAIWNSGLGDSMSLLEVASYRPLWMVLLVLNVGLVLLAGVGLPSMRPPDPKAGEPENPAKRLIREVLSYKTLFEDWIARRLLMKAILEALIQPFLGRLAPAQMMAYHGWSQKDLTFVFMLPQLISIKCMANYSRWFSGIRGELFAYSWTLRLTMFSYVLPALTLPFTHRYHVAMAYLLALFSGFHALKFQIESTYLGQEQLLRFQNVQWLVNYFLGMWVGPMYVATFDAAAESYGKRVLPGLLCCLITALLYVCQFHGMYDLDGVYGWGLALRRRELGLKKATELWFAIVIGPGPGLGHIGEEKYRQYKLEELFGDKFEDVGGTIDNMEKWLHIVGSKNSTPSQGEDTLHKLDLAQAHAWSLWPQDERHRLSLKLWGHLSAGGDVGEETWTTYRLKEFLSLQWVEVPGGSICSLEQFDAVLDTLPKDTILEGLQRSLAHAEMLFRDSLKLASKAASPAPGRQHFLARAGSLGALLMLGEAVFVGRDPGSDIFHALLGVFLWRWTRGKSRLGSAGAVFACFLSLWLGGAGTKTGFHVRPHLVNMAWIIHILVFCFLGVLRYFFELDIVEHKKELDIVEHKKA